MIIVSNGNRSGFVLVLALIVLTLLFAAASGLYLNRQMWAFASTKQMDQTVMDVSSRADAQNWILQFRDVWQGTGTTDGTLNLTTSAVSLSGLSSSSITGGGSFQAVGPYPKYPDTLGTIVLPQRFDTSITSNPARYVSGEPFWGTRGIVGALGVLFRREMGDGYAERQNRFTAPNLTNGTGSKLRAWYSLDGALPLTMVFRVFPVTAFTLFVGYGSAAAPTLVDINSTWLGSDATNYTVGSAPTQYQVSSMGSGRIYVEGQLRLQSDIATGFPIVATDGFVPNAYTFTLNFPDAYAGGTGGVTDDATWATDETFRNNRYSLYRGMMVTSSDAPARLLRRGSVFSDGRWRGSRVVDLAGAMVSSATIAPAVQIVQISADVTKQGEAGRGITCTSSASFSAADRMLIQTYFTWNATASELVFQPPAAYASPESLVVSLIGTGNATYSVRAVVPQLTTPFTLVVPNHPLILQDGFNQGGLLAAMVVSPKVCVANSGAAGTKYIKGAVITEAYSPESPIYFSGANPAPLVELQGPLIIWHRLDADPGIVMVPLKLLPIRNYLSGVWVPPLTPAVADVRASSDGFRIYDIKAVEP